MKSRFILYLLGGALALSGCTVLEGDKIDYKSAGKAPTLDVPPDLTQLAKDSRFAVAGNAVTASSFKPAAGVPAGSTALATLGDVRIERIGNQRWLVVNRPPEALWQPVNDFWKESGFLMSSSQASLGIMETDWAENRAKIPQDFIRSTLGKVLDGLYSSGERDRFRTRLESSSSGGTEIFISHRGMLEVYGDAGKSSTVWQARPADPELEAEMLRRLMVRLGASQEQSKAVQAATPAAKTSRVATVSGQTVVQIDEGFERAGGGSGRRSCCCCGSGGSSRGGGVGRCAGSLSSGCSSRCRCRRRSWHFFFATSGEGCGGDESCQNEGFIHLMLPFQLTKIFRILPVLTSVLAKQNRLSLTCLATNYRPKACLIGPAAGLLARRMQPA